MMRSRTISSSISILLVYSANWISLNDAFQIPSTQLLARKQQQLYHQRQRQKQKVQHRGLILFSTLEKKEEATASTAPPVNDSNSSSNSNSNSNSSSRKRRVQLSTSTATSSAISSARLLKAKQLLEQFSESNKEGTTTESNNHESSGGSRSSTSTSNNQDIPVAAAAASSKSKNKNGVVAAAVPADSKKQKQQEQNKSAAATEGGGSSTSKTTEVIEVPDNFWSNGHLIDQSGSSDVNGSGSPNGKNYVTRWARGVKVAEPLVKYDPVVAEKVLFRQPTKWVVRNIQIALPIGSWAVGVIFDYAMGMSKGNRRKRAKQLLKAISGLGPAIIKGGQALASRPDLLPSEYLEELQKLQDDVPRFSNTIALQTVEEELNIKFDDVFELVLQEPIAAASIGQVYKARIKKNGNLVALKIQRPKCEEIIALDLYILRWWSKNIYNRIFKLLNRDIDVQSIIDDFGVLIYREIDYVAEAANAQRFNELYAGIADVFVPKIYSDLTTSKVLTMEWVDGFRLTDTDNLQKYNLEPSKLVDVLVQCSLRQILENGFFHADPHAGNLLATPDGRLCYLDFGMMSFASQSQRNGFLLAVVHIVNRDWPELVLLYQKLGFIPPNTDLKPIEIAMEDALPDVLNSQVSDVNFANVVNQLGDIMYTYPFSLPPFYISIMRCLGVLEGLAIQVDPQARIVSEAYPYVASRVLTDPQEDLQEAFKRLALTSEGHVRWDRLESLLEEATDATGYEPAAALDIITDYLISTEGTNVLYELRDQIVDATDSLGSETIQYIVAASRALAINDQEAAVKAFRSIQEILDKPDLNSARNQLNKDLSEILPDPTPSMQRFGRIIGLLYGASSDTGGSSTSSTDISKFVPIIRKLSQEPRIQQTANEIIARLGERMLSRGLRAAFGMPPPDFSEEQRSSSSSSSSSRKKGEGVAGDSDSTTTTTKSRRTESTVTEDTSF